MAQPSTDAYDRWSDQDWASPPQEVRPMVRWWWPGGAVTRDGIEVELALLDSLGFGSVEIQPFLFGLPEDAARAAAVRSVGTAAFVEHVDHAIAHARRRGMGADLTMSSGWGLGGPLDCADCGTHQLLMTAFDVTGPTAMDRPLPRPTGTPYQDSYPANMLGLAGSFDPDLGLVAVLRGRLAEPAVPGAPVTLDDLADINSAVEGERLRMAVPEGSFRIFAVYRNRTNTRLAGAAYPGDATCFRTVDHLDPSGLAAFRRSYFDSLTRALSAPPDHYFVDSFEFLADLPWTASFRDAFVRMKGYDVTPYLPLLFLQRGDYSFEAHTLPRATLGEVGERVREDYVDVRAALFRQEFLGPLVEAVHASGARLRLQALGGYGDYLDVFAAADVPEAEDFGFGGDSEFLKLASSAAHVAGRRRASNEAFVRNLRREGGSTGLAEDGYHRMAGHAFALGLNQLVVHGRAYPTAAADSARWYPFERLGITTRLDATNPVWPRLPHLNAALGRMAYAMTRGRPSAQVAWLTTQPLPPELDPLALTDSTYDPPFPREGYEPYRELSAVTQALRRHAVSYDRVSRSAFASSARVCGRRACIGEGRYEMVLMDHASVASVDWLDRLGAFAEAGIPVVFVGAEAERARGFAEAEARDRAVRDAMARLASTPAYRRVATADELGPVLEGLDTRLIRPVDPADWTLATAERSLPSEDVLLLFNGTESEQTTTFKVLREDVRGVVVLDPERPEPMRGVEPVGGAPVIVTIPAGRSRVVRLLRAE